MGVAGPPQQPAATLDPAEPARPQLSRDDLRDVLVIALRAGQLMLENGANTARVEETIHRIGTALGAERVDVYVTPTGIIASDVAGGEHRTKIQRIVRSGIDLNRVTAVLEVSRAAVAGRLDRTSVRAALERIASQPPSFAPALTVLAAALACACNAALFGGGPLEFAAVLAAAGVAQIARLWLTRINLSRLLLTGSVAALASGLALALVDLVRAPEPGAAVLASVILLIPGVVMVSSVADLFRGDTISGMARAVSAVLTLAAIAAGIWTALLVSGAQIGLTPAPVPAWPYSPLLALVSTAGFAVLFGVPRRSLPVCAAVGALAYMAFDGARAAGFPPEAAIFTAGVAIGVLSELLARLLRLPAAIFSIPGFIPLVPGVAAFSALLHFVNADYQAGTAGLVRAILLTGALAAGLGTVTALARLRRAQPAD